MLDLACWLSDTNILADLGKPFDACSAAGLYHRAWRSGDALAAQNMAMSCFNVRDLQGYRRWLRRAANAGDDDAKAELAAFETRLPHATARKIGRHRPERRRDARGRSFPPTLAAQT